MTGPERPPDRSDIALPLDCGGDASPVEDFQKGTFPAKTDIGIRDWMERGKRTRLAMQGVRLGYRNIRMEIVLWLMVDYSFKVTI